MKAHVFKEIRSVVQDASGIQIQDGKESMISARIGQRLKKLSLTDEVEYLEYLKDEFERELVELLNVISTNVTSWYREGEHFKILEEAVKGWASDGQRRMRLWCAASSTGEEPYTICFTMSEALKNARNVDWRLLATDISTRVLHEASEGSYTPERLSGIPDAIRNRYFDDEGSSHRVQQGLRNRVSFKRLNLSSPPFPMKGPLDAIFCRNVMIYFDTELRARLVAEFHRLLKPGGLLISGKSESLASVEGRFERAGPTTYRKLG